MSEAERKERRHSGRVVVVAVMIVILLLILLEVREGLLPVVDIDDPTGEISKILFAVLVVFVTWIVLFYLGSLFERLTLSKIQSHAQVRSMWKLISYAVWILVLSVVVLSLVGDASSLVLYVGLIGAALTFVLQKPLLNVGAWALISYRRLYRIGDRISLGGVKGYVLDITTMYTELREFGDWMKGDTFTGRITTVPNSLIFDQPLYNYTKDFPFIWDEVGNLVTYESDIDAAKKYMMDAAKTVVGKTMEENFDQYRRRLGIRDLHQLLLREPEMRMELADSGVNLYVLYFCPVEARRKVKTEITERIWRSFMADPSVGIAYPHMHIVGGFDNGGEAP